MDGSNDEQVPKQVDFNAKSDMRNVVLKKEMKNRMLRIVQGLKNKMLKEMMMMMIG